MQARKGDVKVMLPELPRRQMFGQLYHCWMELEILLRRAGPSLMLELATSPLSISWLQNLAAETIRVLHWH